MMTAPISSQQQETCALVSPGVIGQSRGHFQGEVLPPVTTRSASLVVRDVLRRMHLSPIERQLLTMLAMTSPAALSDAALLDALGEPWHAQRLHTRLNDLRSKLRPHGLALLRAFNYGYLLVEEKEADPHERMIAS